MPTKAQVIVNFRGGWRDGTKSIDVPPKEGKNPDPDAGLFGFIVANLAELEAGAFIRIDEDVYRAVRIESSTDFAISVRGTSFPLLRTVVFYLAAVSPSHVKHAKKIIEYIEPAVTLPID